MAVQIDPMANCDPRCHLRLQIAGTNSGDASGRCQECEGIAWPLEAYFKEIVDGIMIGTPRADCIEEA